MRDAPATRGTDEAKVTTTRAVVVLLGDEVTVVDAVELGGGQVQKGFSPKSNPPPREDRGIITSSWVSSVWVI